MTDLGACVADNPDIADVIFDEIERACDENTYVGTLSANENSHYPGAKHFVLSDGVHVYRKANATIICDEELGSRDTDQVIHMERYNYNRKLCSTDT